MQNYMKLKFSSKSSNESFARVTVAAFISQLDPTLDEIMDIKTAVSEAVTNSIIHGYENRPGYITIECTIQNDNEIEILIEDEGKGIEDIPKALEPLYTTQPEMERAGMGFTVMQTFMDFIEVKSVPLKGTSVLLRKIINSQAKAEAVGQ